MKTDLVYIGEAKLHYIQMIVHILCSSGVRAQFLFLFPGR